MLFAFRQAYAEKRFDVAEHLLNALETLNGEREGLGSNLTEAYRVISDRSKD